VTETHFAPRRLVRPWSLGGLFGLFLVLVIGVTPAVATAGSPARNRAARAHDASGRPVPTQPVPGTITAGVLPIAGPASVTLGLARLFTTQFDGSRYANGNCNMAAGAMLIEVQTGRLVTGAEMRRWSGARTAGTTLVDLRRAFRSQGQWVQISEDMGWDAFVSQVRSGRSAVVQGWYGNLRDNVLQAGFTTAHSVFVLGYSSHAKHGHGGFYVMDPLGSGGYDGAWWSKQELHCFGWSGHPHTVGTGRSAFYGNVALQSGPSFKRLNAKAYRPAFQSYWDTSKALMKRAQDVHLVARHRGQTPFVLKVVDPHLKLTPGAAMKRNLKKPLQSWKKMARAYRTRGKRLIVRTTPSAKVTAAATGRIVYRGWTLDGSKTLWIQHGPRLFTIYKGLAGTRLEPGQWVSAGKTLGRVTVESSGKKGKKGKRIGVFRFIVAVGDPSHASSRRFPLPYLGGSNGRIH